MEQEAKIYVHGDYVQNKTVEHEIGNVAQGGIGIQIITNHHYNEKAVEEQKLSKPTTTRKPKTNKLIDNTFKYRYLDSEPLRIIKLYQQLQSGQCIAQDTTPEDFSSIFSGKPSNVKVKWLQDTSLLFALIKQINDRSLIEKPTRPGIWQITQSHFVDKDSRQFSNFNKLREPKKANATITKLVDIIDPSIKEDY